MKEKGFIPREFNIICPVDFSNTGVVSESMVWSDGLTQFLEVKHGLKITSENLTTTFLAHFSFIRKYITNKYGNNIYGVTGTLGKEVSNNLLKELFKVDVYIIPPFRPSLLNILEGKTNFKNKEEWKKYVIQNILHNIIKLNRTVFVISLTIEESNELYEELDENSESKTNNLFLFKYQLNDDEEKRNQLKQRYNQREVIFATN
jgi:preprotein translocase subunit SecA